MLNAYFWRGPQTSHCIAGQDLVLIPGARVELDPASDPCIDTWVALGYVEPAPETAKTKKGGV